MQGLLGQPQGDRQARDQAGAEEQADGLPQGQHPAHHRLEGGAQAHPQQVGGSGSWGCRGSAALPSVAHHDRHLRRFHSFLLYLGYPAGMARDVKVTPICKLLREFALEYRTCRERVLQQQKKRAAHRERNKTRGRLITEVRGRSAGCHRRAGLPGPLTPAPPPAADREVLRHR